MVGSRMMAVATAVLAGLTASVASAQSPAPLKLGLILDMSGPYADITGPGSVEAGRMAIEAFGGQVLGRKLEIVFADHQNKADIAGNTAREWFDTGGVEAIMDVAASATALAVNEVAKARGRILMLSGPGAVRLTNEACGPYTVHYTYDTYALSHGTGLATVKNGDNSWFFITADYAFGQDLERDASNVVTQNGGKVLGSVKHPLNTADFSSFLLQAQASGAKVVGLANAGADTINAVKQAHEFGLTKGGQKLAVLLGFLSDIDSLGLDTAQGLLITEAFYWNLDDQTRDWSKRFFQRTKRMPTSAQAGVYSEIVTYLNAVKAVGTTEPAAVMKSMKGAQINDFFSRNGRIRDDGRMIHDMYLFQVKTPAESKGRWDDYKLLETIPGEMAFQALSDSRCPQLTR